MENIRIEQNELVIPAMYGLRATQSFGVSQSHNWLILGGILYEKGSGINRLSILGSNGIISLIIPVKKSAKNKLISDIAIDNQQRWQHQHWQSIQSCYGKSPYFQYFRSDLEEIYKTRTDFLLDFNLAFLSWIHRQFFPKGNFKVNMAQPEAKINDQMVLLSPVNGDKVQKNGGPKYAQVFGQEFVPDLSILDPLFCVGPEYARW